MTSEDWQAAWLIYDAARDIPADRQQAFVESQSGDPGVAGQVFQLLAALAEEESQPSEIPAVNRTGSQIGRYQIGRLLGRGGMGEVYAAHDTDLDRPVALKFLRPESIGDPAALKGFVQEAKAASTLNHPNILTIYEVIDSGSGLAMAMELVEGGDLRSLHGTPQTAERLIQLGRQIANALAAAHRAGLIHRDIKPENILVRKDGYVKIVDFGLARRVASEPTGPGGLVGTLRYMSPEQALGEAISAASDIFSLGVVLYENATGQHPFPGGSPITALQASSPRVPVPPSSLNPAIPVELDRLILLTLAQDPAARPSAEEIAQTLADLERAAGAPNAGLWTKVQAWAVVGAVLTIASVAASLWPRTARPVDEPAFRQVTTLIPENRATAAAISPDGRSTAYANVDGIFVRATDNDAPKALPAPTNFMTNRLVWSGDGTKLLASGFSVAGTTPAVWMISTNGEAPQLLRTGARSATLSPDGTRVAFINEDRSELWIMDVGGGSARKVLGGGQEELFLLVFWSPDGKRLAYQRRRLWAETDIPNNEADNEHGWRYESADVSTGRIVAEAPHLPMGTAAPLSDGRILFVRADHPYLSAGRTVWEVKTDAATGAFIGQPQKIAEMPESRTALLSLSATTDGKRIMVVKRSDQNTIFVGDFERWPPRILNTRRFTLDERTNYAHAWTADSRAVIFESDRNGNFDLFKQYLDRRTPETIVATPQAEVLAQLAPDGRTVLYALRQDAAKIREFQLMRVPLLGGTPEPVPIGGKLDEFRCSVGGGRCVLRTTSVGKFFAYHELDPVAGKGRELARTSWTRNILGDWDISPDGTQVAIPNHSSRSARLRVLYLVRQSDQPQERELPLPGLGELKGVIWAADGSGWFVVSETEIGQRMFFVLPDGRYHVLGDIQGWAVPSPDGRRVAFRNRITASNAWVLDRRH
jgi:Tol biopolymer transport system component